MSTKELGDKGERLACEYLVNKGYKILERNCVLYCGEIDIVARKKIRLVDFLLRKNDPPASLCEALRANKTVHFVEVKSLSNQGKDFFPEERVDYRKKNKYKRLIEVWLEKNNFPQSYPCQMDIIAVSGAEIGFFENVVAG